MWCSINLCFLTHILLMSVKSALFLMESFITCKDSSRNSDEATLGPDSTSAVAFMTHELERCVRWDVRLAAACGRRGRTSSRAPRCWREEAGWRLPRKCGRLSHDGSPRCRVTRTVKGCSIFIDVVTQLDFLFEFYLVRFISFQTWLKLHGEKKSILSSV